jgi:beta-lactamase regulating signal transducer with metallopeptidase domain
MTVILWFHPLAWLLRSHWRDEIEHRADHAALRQADANAAEYASDLLQIITSGHQHRACPAGVGVGFADTGSSRRFRRRLMRLFETGAETKRGWFFAIAGTILLLTTALIGVACRVQSEPDALTRETQLRLQADPFPSDR